MKCPVCNIALVMSERQGVEIDYCPDCRGIWLDRGELDKIVEKSEDFHQTSHPSASDRPMSNDYNDDHKHSDHNESSRGYSEGGVFKKKKRESFLGDLFDF
jgi:Zn-finger nucleic acid-binding protein